MATSHLISSSCWPFTSWRVIHAHLYSVKWNENYAAWGLEKLMTAVCAVHREIRWHISSGYELILNQKSGSKLSRDKDEAEFHLLLGWFEVGDLTLKMFRKLEFVVVILTQRGARILIRVTWGQSFEFHYKHILMVCFPSCMFSVMWDVMRHKRENFMPRCRLRRKLSVSYHLIIRKLFIF